MSTQQKILQHSLTLFSEYGYEAIGVAQICKECHVTKPSLYYHFKSKAGLLQAICEQYYPDFIAKLQASATYSHNLVANLEQITVTFLQHAQEHQEFTRFAIQSHFLPVHSTPFLMHKPFWDEIFAIINTLFMQAAHDHGNMKNKNEPLAMSFIGLLQSYAGLSLNGAVSIQPQTAFLVVKQFMHGIFS
jgi:AcrR family transcriptional regulator